MTQESKVNEENAVNREFLVNEGSVESAENKDRKVLTEPMDPLVEMELKAIQERKVIRAFLAEMERMEKTALKG